MNIRKAKLTERVTDTKSDIITENKIEKIGGVIRECTDWDQDKIGVQG
jgi:hypothetical protein